MRLEAVFWALAFLFILAITVFHDHIGASTTALQSAHNLGFCG